MPGRSRRNLLQGAATAGAAALAGCGLRSAGPFGGSPAADGPAEWPMHRYDAANTAAVPAGTGPSDLSTVEELLTVSDAPMGVSPPVVSDDLVYAILGELYALTPDGDRRWSWVGSFTPALTADGDVALPTTPVQLLSSADGSVRWTVEGLAANSPATVHDGRIYVGAGGHFVYAIDAADGTVHWRFGAGDHVLATPAVWNGTVYAGSEDATVYALDAATGDEQWRYGTGDEIVNAPVVADGVVFVASGGRLHALDAADGSEHWRYGTGKGVTAPAVTADLVIVADHAGAIVALDPADGSVAWKQPFPAGRGSAPVVVGDRVYVSGNDLHVFEAGSGNRSGSIGRNGFPWTPPVVAGGTVYVSYGWHEYRTLYAASDG